jgi:ribosomal protein L11 methyltransferase
MRRPSLFLLTIEVAARSAEALGGVLMQHGAGAVEERPSGRRSELRVYAEHRGALTALLARARAELEGFGIAKHAVRIESAGALDWQASIASTARPARLTRRLRVEPSDDTAPALDAGTIALRPGLAFGDGSHPTTQLAARAIEEYCARRRRELHVLDVGTGSGVLAFVAAKSGAAKVTAIEIVADALALARENARRNRLAGSVRFRSRWPGGSPAFDLVVANLEPRVLVSESERLARVARNAERLLITGFLVSQAAMVSEGLERAGYSVLGRVRSRGWLLLGLSARPVRGRTRAR